MRIDVANANLAESNRWLVNVLDSSVLHVLCVFFKKKINYKGPTVQGYRIIDFINVNKVKSNMLVIWSYK